MTELHLFASLGDTTRLSTHCSAGPMQRVPLVDDLNPNRRAARRAGPSRRSAGSTRSLLGLALSTETHARACEGEQRLRDAWELAKEEEARGPADQSCRVAVAAAGVKDRVGSSSSSSAAGVREASAGQGGRR